MANKKMTARTFIGVCGIHGFQSFVIESKYESPFPAIDKCISVRCCFRDCGSSLAVLELEEGAGQATLEAMNRIYRARAGLLRDFLYENSIIEILGKKQR